MSDEYKMWVLGFVSGLAIGLGISTILISLYG